MSILNSLKNQVGRDSGKVISNLVFGDKHASVYRRATSKRSQSIADTRSEILEKETSQRLEIDRENALNDLDAAVIENVDSVINAEIINDKNEIIKMIDTLSIQLSVNHWGNVYSKKSRIRNKYPDAVLKKYKICVKKLRRYDISEEEIREMKKEINRYSLLRFLGKHILTIITLLSIFTIIILNKTGVISDDFTVAIVVFPVIIGLAIIAIVNQPK
ncbi:MAG: hypothetical protein WC679_11785 [Bacteroidales bacterium]|jgi:hypothetical protein